jgi:RNA recognition motif-containing protein
MKGFDEDKAHCFLDYENEVSCDHAIRIENNRRMEGKTISVQKCTNSGSQTGSGDSDVSLKNNFYLIEW